MSPAASLPHVPPHNLPLHLTSFVGREREISEVKRLLHVSRLLTLTGPGGSGKTRLALQTASELLDEYEHGVYFVSLVSIADPAQVISEVAHALQLLETSGLQLEESLGSYLRDRHLLLLLDNFEQVAVAGPRVVDLLKAAPDLKVLVTSRSPLQVSGEQQYAVPPMALPDLKDLPDPAALSEVEAANLFAQRARSVQPHFALTDANSPAVAELCHHLDGLPLAIELAAARVNVLTPEAMLEKMKDSLKLLSDGPRDLPARHRTLRSAIEWSYNLLNGQERTLFLRLSEFVGGCTLQAAEAVCDVHGDLEMEVVDGVGSLVNKSLIQSHEAGGEPRFQMLETIREYAREKLLESGEAAAIHEAHALYFMRLAEEAEPHLEGRQQQSWLDSLEEENDNIRAALRWAAERSNTGDTRTGEIDALEIGLRTGIALRQFWDVRGHYREGLEDLQRLVSAAEMTSCPTELMVRALNAVGVLAYRQGNYLRAHSILEQALELAKGLGDRQSTALSLHHLGNVAMAQRDYGAANSMFQESLALRSELGDTWGIAICLHNLGSVAFLQEEYASARSLFEESLALFREEGDKWAIAIPLINLGNVALLQGDYAAARSPYEEGLLASKQVGSRNNVAFSIAGLGSLAAATGQPQRGARLLGAAEAFLEEVGSVLETENRRPYDAGVASARSQLGEGDFRKALQQGRAMTMEQAVAYALDRTSLASTDSPEPPAEPQVKDASNSRGALFPAGLTKREVEVLRAVSQGLTNAQIADRLFLSPNTVNVHLYSIYSKLAINSRSAATRFAIEYHLA